MSSELPLDALEIYKAFGESISRLQRESPPGSCRSFIVPAFVKPSHNGNVTYRQCCIIRFWPPGDMPGTTRDLAERMQLRCFPLFPQSLDWRRAMESVAQRNGADNGTDSAPCSSLTGTGQTLHGIRRRGCGGRGSASANLPSEAAVRSYCDRKMSSPCGKGVLSILCLCKRMTPHLLPLPHLKISILT